MEPERCRLIGHMWECIVVHSPEADRLFLGTEIVNATVINKIPGVVFVNEQFERLAPHVQKAIVAHELGHVINGDLNGHIRGRETVAEMLADLRAVTICGKDPVLEYLYIIRDQTMELRREMKNKSLFVRIMLHSAIKSLTDSLRELNQRIQFIQETPYVRYTQV